MNLQVIKTINGKPEYVLLPYIAYLQLRKQIDQLLKKKSQDLDYEIFDVADYVENPIALARIKVHKTQKELAQLMDVTQAYISKIEHQEKVSAKLLEKVKRALKKT